MNQVDRLVGEYQAHRWSSGVQEARRGDQEGCQLVSLAQMSSGLGRIQIGSGRQGSLENEQIPV